MCYYCDYTDLLKTSGLGYTRHRHRVLEVIGNNTAPLSARDIYDTLNRQSPINRVTVYRILDTLVDSGLVERLSGGGRTFFYGLAPNSHHAPHPHFYCRTCGSMECLKPESLHLDSAPLKRTFPGRIDSIEVRIDGICKNCLKSSAQTM